MIALSINSSTDKGFLARFDILNPDVLALAKLLRFVFIECRLTIIFPEILIKHNSRIEDLTIIYLPS